MAGVTVWTWATAGFVVALAVPVAVACRGPTAGRLAAVQLGTSITTWTLVLMTFAFDQSSFMDLALTLAILSLPGTLAMALFLGRWL